MLKKLLTAALALALPVGAAFANIWPERPINLIVPFSAGGPTDQLARAIAQRLEGELGKSVVVVNATGAGGAIGMAQIARAAPDGYTIGISAYSMMAIAPYLSDLPYDTVKDFTPIAPVGSFPYVLAVDGKSSINSVAELVSKAKASPGAVSSASAGVGTGTHLATVLFGQETGVTFNDIQYKGSGPIVPAIIGGHVDFSFMVLGGVVSLIESGKLKGLATTGVQRHPLLPSVPAVNETQPGFDVVGWYGLFGPAGMPDEIVSKLNAATEKAVTSREMKEYLVQRGYETMVMSSAQMKEQIQRDLKKWGGVIKSMPEQARSGN